MYCKKCGKVIPENSLYCQHCGEQLFNIQLREKCDKKGLLGGFQSLSKGWQICLMTYICWVFLWVILCITDTFYDNEIIFFVFVIALPVLALFAWYYFARLRHDNRAKYEHKEVTFHASQCKLEEQSDSEYSIYPLLEFAKKHGKMQLLKLKAENEDDVISYCVFTNINGEKIHVSFSPSAAGLTAAEISSNKEHLFVVKDLRQTYTLVKI